MEVALYLRVLWRFKLIVIMGLVLAIGLSFLSLYKVGGNPMLQARKKPQYVSYSTLFVTQPGFPWGSLHPPASADPTRFTSLAILYSQLATTDSVQRILRKSGPMTGKVEVAPLLDPSNQEALPLISIAGFADSPAGAESLAARETKALLTFISEQQKSSEISDNNRVLVTQVKEPTEARVFQKAKKTLAIVVFLAVMMATCGLAFLLENLRPRVRAQEAAALRHVEPDAA
jgi:capsular polysaccharide biosynthesis protein